MFRDIGMDAIWIQPPAVIDFSKVDRQKSAVRFAESGQAEVISPIDAHRVFIESRRTETLRVYHKTATVL